MHRFKHNKKIILHCFCLLLLAISFLIATPGLTNQVGVGNRVQLLTKQISLLKSRHLQAQGELAELHLQGDLRVSNDVILRASKSLLDKAALDIAVAKSDLDGITIELTDSEQSVAWLQKNVQELSNQLNVLSVFGKNLSGASIFSQSELSADLEHQKKLLELEKERAKELRSLQGIIGNILQYRKDNLDQLRNLLRTKRLLHIKEQQANDELHFQEIQNHWLQKVRSLYSRLNQLDLGNNRQQYAAIEREIYIANEEASYANSKALIARYKDQIQHMRLLITRNTSISLLNEMDEQVHLLKSQITRLEKVVATRIDVLSAHVKTLAYKRKDNAKFSAYLDRLTAISAQYKASSVSLAKLNTDLLGLRKSLEHALQVELSARQGLPKMTTKIIFDLGKEILILPVVTFQVLVGLGSYFLQSVEKSGFWGLFLMALCESLVLISIWYLKQSLQRAVVLLNASRFDIKRLSVHWLNQHFYEIAITLNFVSLMYYWHVPYQSYLFLVYLACVWIVFKGVLTVFRLCLFENTVDLSGQDVKWYKHLKLTLIIGGFVTGFTVFLHQLPLVYELKLLSDRLFLLFLLVLSVILFRCSHFLLEMIWQRFNSPHPHLEKIARFLSILVPIIVLLNAVVGLLGYMNLVFNLSWYQGIFVAVLVIYLIIRGLLTDLFEEISRIVISYLRNGWFWTEAFLKPLHSILRVLLFLTAWGALFLLYGWDKQSPIVEQLNKFLHIELVHVLKTSITPLNSIETLVVVAIFYWTAKWSREFVYRLLASRTQDSGIRNSFAILTQYSVIVVGLFLCLRVLGVDLNSLAIVASMFAFGIGFGLRDLANNFVSGFLILLERPLRVGDIVSINGIDGEVMYIGSRAVTVRTWDHMELVVPNTEIFNKSFTNWTAKDNIVRTVVPIKVSRHDNPHEVKVIIHNVLIKHKEVLKEPVPEVYLKEISDTLMEFELRYYVNIRQVKSRINVKSAVLMNVWDTFAHHGIKAPFPQHEVFLRRKEMPVLDLS